MTGKLLRLERIINKKTGRTIIVPLDHGYTMGPIKGLENMQQTIQHIVKGNANAVVIHKGNAVEAYRAGISQIGMIIHLSGSTMLSPNANLKVLICTIEEALKYGADAVSIQINLGAENDQQMLKDFAKIGKTCQDWGMPLLAMMYTRGAKVTDEFSVDSVKLAARVANEMGADIVKVNFTGDTNTFTQVVESCSIPVLIAGGEKAKNTKMILNNIKMALAAGARGISIGRNVFQQDNPALFCQGLDALIHKNIDIELVLDIIEGRA
jgi:predicted phospho-2-dehydro-3-deoxyheptonate aldolase